MKAIILVGGFGTRLRPLTLNRPKPLVEFCNQPMMMHQVTQLIKVGVNHVILAVSYKAEQMDTFIKEQESLLGIKITLSQERTPLGTAGPLALARELLCSSLNSSNNNNNETKHTNNSIPFTVNNGSIIDNNEPFFVLNSDIICDYPFQKMLDFHKSHQKEGTIVVTRVDNPSKYGVVVYDNNGLVEQFVEKPSEFVSNKINAGLYIFNKSIINRIELRPTSIEKETFPQMAQDKQLYAIELEGYWMDVGQPKDYLRGMSLFLNWSKKTKKDTFAEGKNIVGNVLIHSTAIIGNDCLIGPDVCIGPNALIGDGVRIKNSCVLSGAKLQSYSRLDGCIVGWECDIGKWVRMENTSVLGECVVVQDEVYLNGAMILPNKTISLSVHEPRVIM